MGPPPPPSPQKHWMDQEVLELSMQRITAATSCDHRRNENGREGKWGGGVEQWGESMVSMRCS